MRQIFESETELGRCDPDRINGHFGDDPGGWIAFAHTTAALTGSKGMLRIEQRCYLRSTERADDLRSQNWVKAEMAFESMLGSKEETTEMVRQVHERFVRKSRKEFLENSILASNNGVCEYQL